MRDRVLVPGDVGYDAERSAWNLNLDHRPRVIVVAATPNDVAAAVRFAGEERLAVGVQAVGHGQAKSSDDDVVLVNTRRLRQLSVDHDAMTVQVEAGVTWRQVIDTAATYGLAPLNGSTSGVSAVGYLTGGGLPVLGRAYGYAADRVRSVELVTADGRTRQASPTEEPDLFWAVRGGMDNFGIVTSAELELVPQARFYGGGLIYPGTAAEVVLPRWIGWATQQPDEMSTSLALMRFPDVPSIPAEVRGQFLVHVRIAHTGSAAEGDRLLRPLRGLEPVMDTVAERPYVQVDEVHEDPKDPLADVATGSLLGELDDEFVQTVVGIAGPNANLPPGPFELRRLGGALGRPPSPANPIGHRDAAFLLVLAMINKPGQTGPIEALQDRIVDQLGQWTTGGKFPNFLGDHADSAQVQAAYRQADYNRLRAIKATYDPENLFRINHNIPPRG